MTKINDIFPHTFKALRHRLGYDQPRDERPMWLRRLSTDSDFCRAVTANGYLTETQMHRAAGCYRLLPPQAVKYLCEDYCIDLPETLQDRKVVSMSPIYQNLVRELQMTTCYEGQWMRVTDIPL